jgi:hypothetical protein
VAVGINHPAPMLQQHSHGAVIAVKSQIDQFDGQLPNNTSEKSNGKYVNKNDDRVLYLNPSMHYINPQSKSGNWTLVELP